MPRLFVAIDLPDSIKDQLEGLCAGVSGAKWVGREQMHLTLRFIGEVDEARYSTIKDALAAVHGQPFRLHLGGVGQFPPKGSPRVLWVGVPMPPELVRLQRGVEHALVQLDIAPEDRPFAPHITLARLKTPPPPESTRQFLAQHAPFRTPLVEVAAFSLYSSVLAREGARYHREALYPLTASHEER
jgi:2'-5' RNA ligase